MTRPVSARPMAALMLVVLVGGQLPARAAPDGGGSLAVVNLEATGHEVVERAVRELGALVGGWSQQPGVGALLTGRPGPGSLPAGQTGKDLLRLVVRLRSDRTATGTDIAALGRLLGVDYLLLIRVRESTIAAQLYSVHRGRYAPNAFAGKVTEVARLRDYVREQTAQRAPAKRASTRWWIWAIAAGLAALTIGLAVSGRDDSVGDLRVRVSR